MQHFTLFVSKWASKLLVLILFAVSAAAHAADFGPAPLQFNTESLVGSYEITFEGCASDNLFVEIVNLTDYTLVDASGAKVPYSFVVPTMKDDYTVSLSVGGVEDAPAGTYTIHVPVAAFCLGIQSSVTSDAFDVTINYKSGSTTEPDTPGTDEVDPSAPSNVATFYLDDHKSDNSLYFHDGDIIESNAAGIFLKFNRVGMESEQYSYSYKSNGGFVQFKDCQFAISAPYGMHIQKVVFDNATPQSTTYLLDNLVAQGYNEGTWTGNAESVVFKTDVISYPIYDYDDEDNEYIVGYSESITAARVKRIYVTLDADVDKPGNGIDGLSLPTASAASAPVFDIQGRRSSGAQKGFYIVNGKKVIR